MLAQLLRRGFDSEFSFDRNRVIFAGGSQGSSFLLSMIQRIGEDRIPDASFFTQLSGGVILHCGGLGSSLNVPNPPLGFAERFKVFVQATTEDFVYASLVQNALSMRNSGWNVFSDFSNPGDHCSLGKYSSDEAIGWILGTTRYTLTDGTGEKLGLMSKLLLSESPGNVSESVKVKQGADGKWRIGEQIIESGYELVRDGRKFILELSDDETLNAGWRIAEYTISSVAGIGPRPDDTTESAASPLGDGGSATEAQLWDPLGVAVDAEGVVHFADEKNHRIRKIDTTGVITTIAGTGVAGYGGDGGPATQATLQLPSGVAVDAGGNVYFADTGNHRIRKIDTAGVITTIAGTGVAGYGGDGGPATQATLQLPSGVAVDANGYRVFFADTGNHRIRKIETTGVITTIAGTGVAGYGGDGGPATQATLRLPSGVAVDANGYRVFFADTGNHRIRSISLGSIRTAAITPYSKVRYVGVALDWFNNLYFTSYNTIIKRRADYRSLFSLSKRGSFSVVAGRFAGGADTEGGLAGDARFGSGFIAVSDFGRIVIADDLNDRIRVLEPLQDVAPTYLDLTREALSTMHFFDRDNYGQVNSGSTIQAGTRITLDIELGHSAPVSVGGILELTFLSADASATSTPQFSSGSRQVQFLIPAGTTSAVFANQSPVLDLLSGETGGRLSIALRIATTTGKIDLTPVPAPVLHLDVETSGDEGNAATGINLSVNPRTVSESNGPTTVRVTATLVGGLQNLDTVVNVTVAGTVAVEGVDFTTVNGLELTIPAGGESGSKVLTFQPIDDDLEEGDETLEFRGTATLGGEQREAEATLILVDDDKSSTRVTLTLDKSIVPESVPATTVTVTAKLDAKPRTEDTTVTVTVAGSGLEAAVDFSPVPSFLITIPAGDISGTGTFGLRPENDAVDERDERLTVSGITNVATLPQVTGATLTLTDDDVGEYDSDGYHIRTVAGSTAVADGIPATSASLNDPFDVAVDSLGNVYVADRQNNRVRKIDTSGIISTLAGTGDWGYGGDGGPAAEAALNDPSSVAVDAAGNVYVADTLNHRIRKIDAAGTISTVAGTGQEGYGGDGGQALEALLRSPRGVAVDTAGNLYVADSVNYRIRKIDAAGTIATVAGTGHWQHGGDGGQATAAALHFPTAVAADPVGNIFVVTGPRVRRIDAAGIITTFAGTGEQGDGGDGGQATAALLNYPTGLAADATGNVYVTDSNGRRVRKVDASGIITTVAGTGNWGDGEDGGQATDTPLKGPSGVALDAAGNLYFSDQWDNRVRKIDTMGIIGTLAGTGDWKDAEETIGSNSVRFRFPRGAAFDASGNFYFADDQRVWKLDSSGAVSAFAGGLEGIGGDGDPATEAFLEGPSAVATDAFGNLYVTEQWGDRVRKIDATGTISTLAGTRSGGDSGDGGPATEAQFNRPTSVAVDPFGNVYVADEGNHRVRMIDPDGNISTLAGTGERGDGGDGGPATQAQLSYPSSVAADAAGNVYVADGFSRVRKIDSSGNITRFVQIANGGVRALAVDSLGNLFVGGGFQILRISGIDGEVEVIAGTGELGFGGDGGPAQNARLSAWGIAVDTGGKVWFADARSRRLRVLERSSPQQ